VKVHLANAIAMMSLRFGQVSPTFWVMTRETNLEFGMMRFWYMSINMVLLDMDYWLMNIHMGLLDMDIWSMQDYLNLWQVNIRFVNIHVGLRYMNINVSFMGPSSLTMFRMDICLMMVVGFSIVMVRVAIIIEVDLGPLLLFSPGATKPIIRVV
jgi:hypothetical protein